MGGGRNGDNGGERERNRSEAVGWGKKRLLRPWVDSWYSGKGWGGGVGRKAAAPPLKNGETEKKRRGRVVDLEVEEEEGERRGRTKGKKWGGGRKGRGCRQEKG